MYISNYLVPPVFIYDFTQCEWPLIKYAFNVKYNARCRYSLFISCIQVLSLFRV